jgi:hypothetical protein
MPWPLLLLHWLGWWVIFTFSFVLAGGLIGGLLYLGVGGVLHPEHELGYRLSKGFLNGAEYFGVWAGGLGIVLCWIKAHREGRFL